MGKSGIIGIRKNKRGTAAGSPSCLFRNMRQYSSPSRSSSGEERSVLCLPLICRDEPRFPNGRFPYTAPIPHQFAMKVYVDTWIYATEKFGNMGFIEVYRGILRYETGIYPTIPSFICCISSFRFMISNLTGGAGRAWQGRPRWFPGSGGQGGCRFPSWHGIPCHS